MSYHHCSECGQDAEEDPMSWCGDRSCCSPSHLLACDCPQAYVCCGDHCAEEHAAEKAGREA